MAGIKCNRCRHEKRYKSMAKLYSRGDSWIVLQNEWVLKYISHSPCISLMKGERSIHYILGHFTSHLIFTTAQLSIPILQMWKSKQKQGTCPRLCSTLIKEYRLTQYPFTYHCITVLWPCTPQSLITCFHYNS